MNWSFLKSLILELKKCWPSQNNLQNARVKSRQAFRSLSTKIPASIGPLSVNREILTTGLLRKWLWLCQESFLFLLFRWRSCLDLFDWIKDYGHTMAKSLILCGPNSTPNQKIHVWNLDMKAYFFGKNTGSSRLMKISLMRILLLRFFKTITKNLPNALIILLMRSFS